MAAFSFKILIFSDIRKFIDVRRSGTTMRNCGYLVYLKVRESKMNISFDSMMSVSRTLR